MSVLLKILAVYLTSIIAQFIFNYVNFKNLFSELKWGAGSGVFKLNFYGKLLEFEHWWTFAPMAWLGNAVYYVVATIFVVWSYYLSVRFFNNLTSAILISTSVNLLTSLLFARISVGELPNRNGWIAIALIMLASFFIAHNKS